jgi:hypothetical protein
VEGVLAKKLDGWWSERWISIPQMEEIVFSRYPDVSIGWAKKLVKDAIDSGEVRPRPHPAVGLAERMAAAREQLYRNEAAGRPRPKPDLSSWRPLDLSPAYSEDDFVYRLGRELGERKAGESKPRGEHETGGSKPHVPRLRDAGDIRRIEDARKLYARGNISKTAAVIEVLAPGMKPGRIPKTLMTHINRLRKKV